MLSRVAMVEDKVNDMLAAIPLRIARDRTLAPVLSLSKGRTNRYTFVATYYIINVERYIAP